MYLHDKPGPDNCPQAVYDALVDTLEHVSEYEGYILESGQGLARILFRQMFILLSHPQQRCVQDDMDIPKSLTKKSPAADSVPEDSITVSSQWDVAESTYQTLCYLWFFIFRMCSSVLLKVVGVNLWLNQLYPCACLIKGSIIHRDVVTC